MRGEDEPGPRGGQRFGNMPGEPAVVADAGHQGDLAFQINRYHEILEFVGSRFVAASLQLAVRNTIGKLQTCRHEEIGTILVNGANLAKAENSGKSDPPILAF
jgi:hypothetical protein